MKAEIYTKDNCGYCVRAKGLFLNNSIDFEEIDAVSNRDALIARVEKETGKAPKTVPQIWIDGVYIGGHDDLVAWLKERP